MVLEFLHGATAHTVGGNYMSKLKRPTLETTKNCISILKELYAVQKGQFKEMPEMWRKQQLAMVLTMLTRDERYIKEVTLE